MTSPENPDIEAFGLSDVGRVRPDNQDAIRLSMPMDGLAPRGAHLYALADGMGGFAHGGVASSLALETLYDTFYNSNGLSIPQKLSRGIQSANLSVYQTAQRLGVGKMGTTLTAVSITGRTLTCGHVGDSRAYLLRGRTVTCLTNDHTRVGELVRMKLLSPDKVRTHSQRNVLLKCLGLDLFIQADIANHDVRTDDIVVLCSDGVWSVIQDEELARLAENAGGPEPFSRNVLEMALDRGSDDNVSVIAMYIRHLPRDAGEGESAASRLIPGFIKTFLGKGR